MIDWQRLEQEMADLHYSERIADRIVQAARRHRARRGALMGAVAVAVAAAVAVPLFAVGNDGPGSPQAASGAHRAGAIPARGSAPPPQVQAAIYAAALAGAARPVWVRDHVCNQVPTAPASSPCRDAPIPEAVQRAVIGLLGRAIRFAPDPPVPSSSAAGTVVGFGRLRVHGDSARLGMETACGALCGQGETLTLRLRDGRWQVSGSIGPRWVS